MHVRKKDRSYTSHTKYIRGEGFMDSLSPILRYVGSYLYQNKHLLVKPLIGATGELTAFGLRKLGEKQILNFINRSTPPKNVALSSKELEMFQNVAPNIIGSGIKRF